VKPAALPKGGVPETRRLKWPSPRFYFTGSEKMMIIRKMTEQDDMAVSQIVSACYRIIAEPDGITLDQRDRLIAERCQPEHMAINRARYTCHVADSDGSVVGFIASSGSDIEELFVHPKHHRRGIATALFRKAEADGEHSVLTVGTTGYGIPFYKAMGMCITGKRLVTFGPLEGKELIQLEKRRPIHTSESIVAKRAKLSKVNVGSKRMKPDYPILEHDGKEPSLIEPSEVLRPVEGMPERCVLPIYHQVIESLRAQSRLTHVTDLGSSMGPLPVFRIEHEGQSVAVAHPGMCAPFVAAFLEELIAFGCRKFVACGSAGVLDKTLARGTVVIPNAAVRDEGASYHYVAPEREIQVDPAVLSIQESIIKDRGIPYRVGKTWTTDAIYRETRSRIARRKAEGCLTVEMECSAFLAVAEFRGVKFGQFLATGDDVSGSEWDPRHTAEHRSFPETLFWLSVEACLKL
jgi:uridine phosphorylase